MKHTAINVGLFAAILGAMVGIQHLDGITDNNGYEHQVAKEELAKQRREDRLAEAAREMCGPNGSWALTQGKNEIVCKARRR